MKKLIKKIKVTTTLQLITGLHIGGSKENVEIGGIDIPVIRTSIKDNQPYIPGSSLKGKMRSLLEQISGSPSVGGNEEINDLFGYSNSNKPSKIIVRDAYLSANSIKRLNESENLDMPFTEGKWENVINRVKGTAEHPRQTERIPADVSFDVQIIINVWDNKEDGEKSLALLKKGITALENDYLGGNGSRGYGQVKFTELKCEDIPFDKYFENEK
jgi:CRISPR-associated protein Csm3